MRIGAGNGELHPLILTDRPAKQHALTCIAACLVDEPFGIADTLGRDQQPFGIRRAVAHDVHRELFAVTPDDSEERTLAGAQATAKVAASVLQRVIDESRESRDLKSLLILAYVPLALTTMEYVFLPQSAYKQPAPEWVAPVHDNVRGAANYH